MNDVNCFDSGVGSERTWSGVFWLCMKFDKMHQFCKIQTTSGYGRRFNKLKTFHMKLNDEVIPINIVDLIMENMRHIEI